MPTYEIRYNLNNVPVTDADILVATDIPDAVQVYTHMKDAVAQGAPSIVYGIKAMDVGGSSAWVSVSVGGIIATTTTLTVVPASVTSGKSVVLTADTSADVGTIQFKKDGANLGTPIPVSAAGLAYKTDAPTVVGNAVYGAEYIATGQWGGSISNNVTVPVALPPPVVASINLVAVTSNTSATFQVLDQYGAVMPGKVLNVRTWYPGGTAGSNGTSPAITADGNGIATLNHTQATCHSYQPYSGAINGPWQGLPVSGGTVYAMGSGGTNTQFAIDCDDLLCYSLLAPTEYFGTLTTLGLGIVGGSYSVYGLSGTPSALPLTQKAGAGTWTAGPYASFWLSGSQSTYAPGPGYLHLSNSPPTLGQPVNSTLLGLVPEKAAIGSGNDPPPLVVPVTWASGAQWVFVKAQGDNGWHRPDSANLGYALTVNGKWGYMNCTWTP